MDKIEIIKKVFNVEEKDIKPVSRLKAGMTNDSFLFECKGEKYILRIPGVGTDNLINRYEQADVYSKIKGKNICDDVIFIDPKTGCKITKFLENVRNCDASREEDLKLCMEKLSSFHNMKLKVEHEFNIFEKIEYYEKLWNGKESEYNDYKLVKENVYSLKEFIEKNTAEKVLAHIDSVPDNFLIDKDKNVTLIDWEYSGMQDPHVDIAMFCIYDMYDRENIDKLIDIYFKGKCEDKLRIKIYAYISACGLLWSNWCEYKKLFGEDFGDYALSQYNYAKDYYKIVVEELSKLGE